MKINTPAEQKACLRDTPESTARKKLITPFSGAVYNVAMHADPIDMPDKILDLMVDSYLMAERNTVEDYNKTKRLSNRILNFVLLICIVIGLFTFTNALEITWQIIHNWATAHDIGQTSDDFAIMLYAQVLKNIRCFSFSITAIGFLGIFLNSKK